MPVATMLTLNKGWSYYKQYVQSDYDDAEVRQNRQWKKLKKVLSYAYNSVSFYRKKFDKAGVNPDQIRTAEDFRKIPITTKLELRRNFPNEIISQNYSIRNLRYSDTSGTSGASLVLVHDHEDINHKYASKLRSRHLMGAEIGDSELRITPNECQPCLPDGSSPYINILLCLWMFITNHKYKKQAYYITLEKGLINPILHIRNTVGPLKRDFTDDDLGIIVERIKKYEPKVLSMYPLYAQLFAKYIGEHNVTMPGCAVIDLTAGLSTRHMRKHLAEKFNAPVSQIYGGCEFGRLASGCQKSDGLMHILEDHCYVEFIRSNGEYAKPEELSNIIITSLTSNAMPLIRYEHGDIGQYYKKHCDCGRTTQLMDVAGRLQDLIVTESGDKLTPEYFVNKYLDFSGIRLFRLIQRAKNKFIFQIMRKDNEIDIDIVKIENMLRDDLGNDIEIKIKYVDFINPEPSGKYRLVVSSSYEKFRCV